MDNNTDNRSIASAYKDILINRLISSGIDVAEDGTVTLTNNDITNFTSGNIPTNVKEVWQDVGGQKKFNVNDVAALFKIKLDTNPDYVCKKFTQNVMNDLGDEIRRENRAYFELGITPPVGNALQDSNSMYNALLEILDAVGILPETDRGIIPSQISSTVNKTNFQSI